jgi:hypothetical protein
MALKRAKSGEVVDLRPLGDKLNAAKTSAIIKSEHFEAIRLIVHAGSTIRRTSWRAMSCSTVWKATYGSASATGISISRQASGFTSIVVKTMRFQAWRTHACS